MEPRVSIGPDFGAILEMSKQEIGRKFDAIIEFAGLSDFIDTPVKRSSSGMHARLAFVFAAHLEPEILLLVKSCPPATSPFRENAWTLRRDYNRPMRRYCSCLAICSASRLCASE